MATKPREWPENAKTARDQASEQAARALRALRPILDRYNTMNREELIYRIAVAIDSNQTICRYLEQQGAPTLPEEI
jgi:hypothetical protein